MLIASFYDNAFNKQFAVRLRATAEALGIRCRVFDRSERPGMEGKSGWKPEALLQTLAAYPGDDVFLVDPDSVLKRRPDILLNEQDFDAAVHYNVETLVPSGPLFVRNNDRVRRMMEVWRNINRALPEHEDLENLSRVLSDPQCPLEIRRLPVTYAWVERIHRKRHLSARPVLTHFLTDGMISTRFRLAR
jgi:hypothetical protein